MSTPSPFSFFLKKKQHFKSRHGVSPVIATTIILAITVALGLALWSFANSGVGTATLQYSQAVDEYGQIVRYHRFIVANLDFDNPSANHIAFWIYNNGKLETTLSQNLILTCKDCSAGFSPNPTALTQHNPDDIGQPFTVFPNTLKKFTFDTQTTLEPDKTYEITVISESGLSQIAVKKSD